MIIPELLTVSEVKRILKVSRSLVYRWAQEGRLPCVRWGCPGQGEKRQTIVRFRPEDVQRFIEEGYQPRL